MIVIGASGLPRTRSSRLDRQLPWRHRQPAPGPAPAQGSAERQDDQQAKPYFPHKPVLLPDVDASRFDAGRCNAGAARPLTARGRRRSPRCCRAGRARRAVRGRRCRRAGGRSPRPRGGERRGGAGRAAAAKRQRRLAPARAARPPARPRYRLMRSISSGARCCNSSAVAGATRSFKTPSRPSAWARSTAASSAPTTAGQSALRRARTPPPAARRSARRAARRRGRPRAARAGARSAPPLPVWRSAGRLSSRSRPCRRSEPCRRSRNLAAGIRAAPDAAALLAWYDRHRRDLPWRAPPGERADPYRVWLSEIMLQQTTVATVAPYFDRFVARWPDVRALAAASLDEVLHRVAGARLLRPRPQPARLRPRSSSSGMAGAFPDDVAGAARTAGDRRLHRGGDRGDRLRPPRAPRSTAMSSGWWRGSSRSTSRCRRRSRGCGRSRRRWCRSERAGDFAQAMMDLGATICTPRRPRCVLCPWRSDCAAAAPAASPESLPARGREAGAAAAPRRRVLARAAPDGAVCCAAARRRACSAA